MEIPDDDNFPEIMLSRAGVANPTGKLDEPLKTHVDIDTALEFRRMCSEAGMDTAKALRDFVFLKVHGKTFADKQEEELKVKRDQFFSTGPNQVQIGGAA